MSHPAPSRILCQVDLPTAIEFWLSNSRHCALIWTLVPFQFSFFLYGPSSQLLESQAVSPGTRNKTREWLIKTLPNSSHGLLEMLFVC